jgi:hypothetical protein
LSSGFSGVGRVSIGWRCGGVISGISIVLHRFHVTVLCQHHGILVTMESSSVTPPPLVFLLRVAVAVLCLSCFRANPSIVFLVL